ncbi:AraC-like DNA-binding protein [Luteibacter jiangsuensis]|uniref:AraC-like DNA-binding protein n=1 Tax=Luteibacter jiangsuensis TaxID=637577 RepID=A0ABT9SW69_9GAMM|nr:AraC family transcriptional regulator [Luteibacter jiangsuensis]MDQ0009242.1 AraC-like DNA-binding protein [Luteibacter jiangsuensis]
MRQLLNQALRQLADFDRADRAACAHYIALALRIHRESTEGHGERRQGSGLAAWQVQVVEELALTRLDTPLAITKLAAACNLSRGYFSRAFKATFGESPHRWRHGKRLEQACHRLAHSNEAIADIAIAFGFNDQAHFTRAFKSALGMTPNVYRRRGKSS